MAQKDKRALATATGGRMRTAGRIVVKYRDAKGHTYDATVVAAGSSSGLKIKAGRNTNIIDNVPLATTMHDNNAYYTVSG